MVPSASGVRNALGTHAYAAKKLSRQERWKARKRLSRTNAIRHATRNSERGLLLV
jgi:hypothetical protein